MSSHRDTRHILRAEIQNMKEKRSRLDKAVEMREKALARLEAEHALKGDSAPARTQNACP